TRPRSGRTTYRLPAASRETARVTPSADRRRPRTGSGMGGRPSTAAPGRHAVWLSPAPLRSGVPLGGVVVERGVPAPDRDDPLVSRSHGRPPAATSAPMGILSRGEATRELLQAGQRLLPKR